MALGGQSASRVTAGPPYLAHAEIALAGMHVHRHGIAVGTCPALLCSMVTLTLDLMLC